MVCQVYDSDTVMSIRMIETMMEKLRVKSQVQQLNQNQVLPFETPSITKHEKLLHIRTTPTNGAPKGVCNSTIEKQRRTGL